MRVIARTENKSNEMNKTQKATNEHGLVQKAYNNHSITGKLINQDEAETLNMSKSRFAAAVSRTISDLMILCGYSRSRATAVLLQGIRGENPPPSDPKVRKLLYFVVISA